MEATGRIAIGVCPIGLTVGAARSVIPTAWYGTRYEGFPNADRNQALACRRRGAD